MTDLMKMGQNAVVAKYELQNLSTKQKNEVLIAVSKRLVHDTEKILHQNNIDIEEAQKAGMHPGLIDRLRLTESRIRDISLGIEQIAELNDPVGALLETIERPNGLVIKKVRVPIGVIGIFYESRPNVTADAFSLCFKTGNAVILKGGSDAIYSNIALTNSIRDALTESHVNPDCVQLIEDTDRETARAFMKLSDYVDLLIPRGGAGLIKTVKENSTIPVIETGTGNCHIYVDDAADVNKLIPILINAKTQRIGVCNACESLVVHEAIADMVLPLIGKALQEHQVEIRGDESVLKSLPYAIRATEEDYGKEYLDTIISIKVVKSIEDAISHINRYNTKHSESIITENMEHADQFLKGIDAACVYVNASTRFTDGFMFGFGAEIGISTQKIHARGPMGLNELTSYKYMIYGNGQIRE
ncbi:MAG: glutamate-5-semialdehyde dehydrogenase [Lachnospiraceae bacterium]|nr:glutamate-5-semialdehyde dehydrogenase [Lachnospiraceae bacterium]MDD3659221.1 glutamate-5-semialdehyde dehydrogenase [Lachnospiraceae bacterium]